MKYDANKLFPYPVLRSNSDDYRSGAFQATIQYSVNKSASHVRVEADLVCSEDRILELIEEKSAVYLLMLESRETFFRSVIESGKPNLSRTFSGGKLKGRVNVSPYIVATKTIPSYNSPNLNEEYKANTFDLKKGDVLALDFPREFIVIQEMFQNIGSVFRLVKSDKIENGRFEVNLDQDKIHILVSEDQKKILDQARTQRNLQPILMSSIYFPVLMQVISVMANGKGDFDDRRWYQAIKSKCDQQTIELDDSTECLTVAQKLLNFPINRLNSNVLVGG